MELENYIDMLHRTHLDNAKSCYQAINGPSRAITISPITNLVFELFLFNSLYSVDWTASSEAKSLVYFSTIKRSLREKEKQHLLLEYCQSRSTQSDCVRISKAFSPIAGYLDSDESWKVIESDGRINREMGEKFFQEVRWIAERAAEQKLIADDNTFDKIKSCTDFIYLVRNNIFHGQKKLGEIHDRNHLKRLSIYDLFIRCVNSLFFLVMGESDFGSLYAQYPIRIVTTERSPLEISVDQVSRLTYQAMELKLFDSFLHWQLSKVPDLSPVSGAPKGVLFYPSAGRDLLFPLILGLPHCDEFHFFDRSIRYQRLNFRHLLQPLGVLQHEIDTTTRDDQTVVKFRFADVNRRILLRKQDNMSFLEEQTAPRFYFHRGDSNGEGGSDQNWDGELIQELVSRSDERGLLVVTDGKPFPVYEEYRNQLQAVCLPSSRSTEIFYAGILHK